MLLYSIKKEKKKKEGTYCEDEDAPWTSGTSTSYVRRIKLKHQEGKKADLARNTRRMRKEWCRSHPLHIKYKTTTPLAALMRK